MIKWFKRYIWDVVFYKDEPFFKFDGWFGRDKVGHFFRHVIFVTAGLLTGGTVWCIVIYDTLFDILYEYKDYCRGNGFSIMDIVYGRAGMLVTLNLLPYILSKL